MTIQTILFDFDGTLADSNELIAVSHLHVLEKHFPGIYTRQSVSAFNGPSLEETYSQIYPEKKDQLIAEYREFNHQHHDDYLTRFPGVKASLEKLQSKEIQIAVVSTKVQPILGRGLELLEIASYVELILGGNDYVHPKPHPEPLLMAMEKLGANPETTIMVGDNWQDLEAANRAGIRSVFVSWSEKTAAEMAPFSAHKVTDSMIEFTDWVLTENNGGN